MAVIKVVAPDPGYAQIPNAFCFDKRLSEHATAVGLFLAAQRDGYRIRPIDIQEIFSQRPGKTRGREWWSRVSSELKDANYMWLSRTRKDEGKFSSDWYFCGAGLPTDRVTLGSAASGSPAGGKSSNGEASAGTTAVGLSRASIQEDVVLKKELQLQQPDRASRDSGSGSGNFIIESTIAPHSELLKRLLGGLPASIAQNISDEFCGAVEAANRGLRPSINSPRGWLGTMIRLSKNGEFLLDLGENVQRRRAKNCERLREKEQEAPPSPVNKEEEEEEEEERMRSIARSHLEHLRSSLLPRLKVGSQK